MILNITDLKKWIKDEIVEELDHKNLVIRIRFDILTLFNIIFIG
jgi:6-pyruvoyl-tetrahydropterin synthase